jgi:alkylation response protein AidB-like acyl-CoA dehydrogenase
MSQVQQAVVDVAERLTRERIAPRSAGYDAAGANPVESWRDLWREGLLAGAIPRSHGGLGLDMATYVAVIRTIAHGCASTAMTVHMHSTGHALHRRGRHRRAEAPVLRRGRPARQALRQLGQRARGEASPGRS